MKSFFLLRVYLLPAPCGCFDDDHHEGALMPKRQPHARISAHPATQTLIHQRIHCSVNLHSVRQLSIKNVVRLKWRLRFMMPPRRSGQQVGIVAIVFEMLTTHI
jgi:hypothetical protein